MRVALSWSGGKDAAWCLHLLRRQHVEVRTLITTIDQRQGRVTGHGVRREIIRQQAAAVGLPLVEVDLPWPCSDQMYQFAVGAAFRELENRHDIEGVAFGDIALRDVRAFRGELLREVGLEGLFPLWGMRTDLLARAALHAGVEAYLAVVDPKRIDPGWVGHRWSLAWIDSLPSAVDPCGENGEFHTLVVNGPMFDRPVAIETGAIEERDGLMYADFLPERIPV